MTRDKYIPAGRLPALKVIAGAGAISFSAVFVKLAHVTPTVAGFYRMAVGGIVLALLLAIKGENVRQDGKRFLMVLACGFFLAADLFFWHICIHIVGPGLATILSNFQAIFLAGFGFLFLREKISFRIALAIPLAILGLYFLVGVDWEHLGKNYLYGLALGILAAMAYAGYLLLLRMLQGRFGRLSAMADLAWICLVCAFFMGGWAAVNREPFLPPDLQTVLSLLGYGIVCQVIGWLLISKGLPHLRASLGGLLLLLQPALAFAWDMLFFGRPATWFNIMGAALALSAIYLGFVPSKKDNRQL